MTDKDKDRDDQPAEPTADDTEGHNLFALSDYYVNKKIGRHVDFERDARQNSLVKEARSRKKPDRR